MLDGLTLDAPPAAEIDHGQTDFARIDARHVTAPVRYHRQTNGRVRQPFRLLNQTDVAALRGHELDKLGEGRARSDYIFHSLNSLAM